MNFFGFKLKELNKRISLKFEEKAIGWKRFASQLVKDRVILDLKDARKFLKIKGNAIVYEVFNLWKFVKNVEKISKETKIACDLTLIRNGIFSISDRGELFLTYGHLHKKEFGEAYSVLKNDCFLVLTDKSSEKTFIIGLKEGDSILIHPKFIHRLTSYKKDSLIIGFVPQEAGHNYKIIKNKGFPFHIFYDKRIDRIKILKNDKYKKGKLSFIKRIESKIDPIRLFKKEAKRLRRILENPEKYKKLYL